MASHQNILSPDPPREVTAPRFIEGAGVQEYETYLTDESRRKGTAAAIVFPSSTAEVCGAVQGAAQRGLSITVSNARTGIAGGAVPEGGLLLSLERLNRVLGMRPGPDDSYLLHCEAGVLLSEVQHSLQTGSFADSRDWDDTGQEAVRALKKQRYFYPPDPTETGAGLGGTIACNASGAHTFRYGPTRPYVHSIRVVLADGRLLRLERGQVAADDDGRFGLRMPDGKVRWGYIPNYRWPSTKNAGGYYAAPGMDLLDLFIGSEGTLGIVVDAEIRIIPAPDVTCAVMSFWRDEGAALEFVKQARTRRDHLGLEAIEYFGPRALGMLRHRRQAIGPVSGVPSCLPEDAGCGIYLDLGTSRERFEQVLQQLADLIQACGSDPAEAWSAIAGDERERLRVFRHALPETVNATIADIRRQHPSVTKLGTDMAVPDDCLERVMALYRKRLNQADLDYVIFGHIGDNHLHVNIIPRTPEEYDRGWKLYHDFAEEVVRMGGSPAAEHGIGKLKTDFLAVLYGDEGIREMLDVKAIFDPRSRLGVGTLFHGAKA